ncbi:aquaporin family protein [Niabella sp. CC-SYL272]|uniref:MIP/aquaporin family protein n=1 Tax=Niabella agricola TaxID=2891571 RepID=UPI001F183F38|nr:MIP/aquaporin family protein [Niabella agricola]MCF3112177.1 aquaporin family protein [Niabella agricola]
MNLFFYMWNLFKEFLGETVGTFIVVFLGCGAVAVSLLFHRLPLTVIAAVWGMAVVIAVYSFRSVCSAHFNPAVSIAMVIVGRFQKHKLVLYFVAQVFGAILAAAVLYLALHDFISGYEKTHRILRGADSSVATARMFGEFYAPFSVLPAVAAEFAGTFLLTATIFVVTQPGKKKIIKHAPVFIGSMLALLICVFAPITQAGLNPARDLGPRLVAWFAGWGAAAFPDTRGGFFWVYILAPFTGAAMAAVCWNYYRKRAAGTVLKMKYENK